MKICLFTIPLIAAVSFSYGTSITFQVEVDELVAGGNPINKTERDSGNFEALGFFVSGSEFSSFVGNEVWGAGSQTSITTSQFSEILGFLNPEGLSGAEPINPVPGAVPISFLYNESIDSGSAGNHAVMLIHDAGVGNVGSVTTGNFVGVVATTFQTLALSSEAIGFNTTNAWDTTLLGESGSLNMAQVVPEPSTFAALAGLLAFSFAMVRRRV